MGTPWASLGHSRASLGHPGAALGHSIGHPLATIGHKLPNKPKKSLSLAPFRDPSGDGCICNPPTPAQSKHTFGCHFHNTFQATFFIKKFSSTSIRAEAPGDIMEIRGEHGGDIMEESS